MKKVLALLRLLCAVVFARTKQSIAVLPTVGGVMEPEEQKLLTDKVRELAAKNLPVENFIILKQDQIVKRIGGEEELYRSCKEGVCIGDLAKRIDIDYGARCEVVKVKNRLVLKFELYSVNEDAILETFIDHDAKDIFGMLTVLETRLPDAFKKMISASKPELPKPVPPPLELPKPLLPPEPPKPLLPPEPPKTYTAAAPSGTTFVDARDGKTYKKVKIGSQTWMAENLNYDVPNNTTDVCYENKAENCEKYGRLYNWETAKAACPAGWHLPSDAEWTVLEKSVGGSKTAGKKLKSATGWKYKNKKVKGTDDFGFSALPGGYGISGGSFYSAGNDGVWWSATEDDAHGAWSRYMHYGHERVGRVYDNETSLFSVRCVQD